MFLTILTNPLIVGFPVRILSCTQIDNNPPLLTLSIILNIINCNTLFCIDYVYFGLSTLTQNCTSVQKQGPHSLRIRVHCSSTKSFYHLFVHIKHCFCARVDHVPGSLFSLYTIIQTLNVTQHKYLCESYVK